MNYGSLPVSLKANRSCICILTGYYYINTCVSRLLSRPVTTNITFPRWYCDQIITHILRYSCNRKRSIEADIILCWRVLHHRAVLLYNTDTSIFSFVLGNAVYLFILAFLCQTICGNCDNAIPARHPCLILSFNTYCYMLSVFCEIFQRDKEAALFTLYVYFFIYLCALKTFKERYK